MTMRKHKRRQYNRHILTTKMVVYWHTMFVHPGFWERRYEQRQLPTSWYKKSRNF